MIDPNMLLPLIQAMNKGNSNSDFSQFETLLSALNKNKGDDNKGNNQMNNMMNMLPLLMQLMNKNNNQASNKEPTIEDVKPDPFEPIRNIGNQDINTMLYNLMNKS